ncbi:hypothetical protein KAU51_03675 [Candidatus Parcubacteria bacterium]|nr:hypothetical protein [Candidatus Parcubacteria bacterium]
MSEEEKEEGLTGWGNKSTVTREIHFARLAMAIDCDGYISIRHSGNTYSLCLGVANTNEKLIDWLIQNFRGNRYIEEYRNENWKDKSTWEIFGYPAYKLAKGIKQFLILKQERAEVAIEYFEKCTKLTKTTQRQRPKWLIDRQELYFQQMKTLNRRGKEIEEGNEG